MKNELKKMTVYLDMDGVVADWFGGFVNLFKDQLTKSELKKLKLYYIKNQFVEDCPIRPREFWSRWKEMSNENNGQFWLDLNPFPWSKRLYDELSSLKLVEEVAFLTSPGHEYTLCWEQKRQWLKKHIGTDNIVVTTNKYHCARKSSVLIDDTFKHCKKFIEHGGNAVVWPNAFEILEGKNGTVKHSHIDKFNKKELRTFEKISDSFDAYIEQLILFDIMIPSTVLNNSEEYKEILERRK